MASDLMELARKQAAQPSAATTRMAQILGMRWVPLPVWTLRKSKEPTT